MRRTRFMAAAAAALLGVLLAGCGKTKEAGESQVLQISVPPVPTEAVTPTPEAAAYPEEASETKNGITMVNQYLIDHPDKRND